MDNTYTEPKMIAGRRIYKMPKPPEIPDPPSGWGYVGMGVPESPFIKDNTGVARRFVPLGCKDDYLSPINMWGDRGLQGLRDYAHYCVPMDIWKRIEYPPELNKHAHDH